MAEFSTANPDLLTTQLRLEKARYSKLQNMKMRTIAAENVMLFPSQLILYTALKKVPDKEVNGKDATLKGLFQELLMDSRVAFISAVR